MIKNHIFLEAGQEFNPYKLFVGSFIPNALMKFKGMTGTEKLIWARLAQFAGEKGECYPSIETLAEEVGIEKRQCLRHLLELERLKFIRIERPEGEDKIKHKTNRYFFIWHPAFSLETPEINDTSRGVINDTSRGVINDTSRGVINDTQRESVLRESFNTHTQEISDNPSVIKNVCENLENKKESKPHTPGYLKAVELFKNEDEHVLNMIERQYKDAVVAAKYLDYQVKKGKIAVKNPCALLIKTLKDGLYSDVDEIIREEKQKKAVETEKTKILKPVHVRELTLEEIKRQNDEWFKEKTTELNGGAQNADNSANV